jgi:beta-lactamase class A
MGVCYPAAMRLALIFFLLTTPVSGQTPLQDEIRKIALDARGKVAVACSLPGSNLNCDLEAHSHPPMQSVFKMPLAVYALHLVEQGKFSLDQPIRFLPSDRILPETYSPLQDKYPNADVDVPLRELLRLAASLSDNAAADTVLRVAGGPAEVDVYIKSLGVQGFHLEDGEHALHRDASAQYRNWFAPAGAVQLLRRLSDGSPLTPEHTQLLLGWMKDSPTGAHRMKAGLPARTILMHKTGTSGARDGVVAATNDIGLIALPDGRRLAQAVFVTDAKAGEATREAVIARLAKAAYSAAVAGK